MPSPRSHYLSSVLHDLLADLARDELRAQERAAQLEAQLRLAQEATTCSSMHTIRRMQSSLARAVLHAYASVRPTEPSSMMAEPLMAEPLPHTASMEAFALWMQELLSDGVRMDVNQTPIELPRPTSASGSELQLSEQLGGALRAARLEGALSSTRSMSQKIVQDLLTGLAKTFVETYLRRFGGSPGDVDMLLATNEWQHLLTESSAAFVTRRARLELMDPGTHAVSIPILDPYFWVADDEDDPSSTADPSGQGNLLSRASVSSLWSAPEGAWRAEGSWADERPFGSPLHPRRPASAVTWRNARSPTLNKQPNKQRADKTRLRGWCARHRRDKVTLLVARQEAAKQVLTSWAKRRYLRSSIWRLWHRQMAAAVETIMQRFTEAYDPTLSEDEVARKGLRRVDALAMLKKGLGRQHENAHAIADALEEYCKLGGVDAKVKRGAERFLNALGADLPENSHLPAMRRMYKKEQPHALRIFFSSTFRDMDGEREFFARRYAAELRTLARAQGVFVTFVDLGAGSTPHAESSQEEVVHIGFKQLKQSRYFVHFIGSRYGWRPSIEELKKDTVQEFDCLRTYIPGRSITEVEVVYGALGWGPQSACSPKNAFFYIRSNKFCNNIPLKAKDDYVDGDPCVQSRLADLKLRIRARAAESNKHHGKAISGASLPFVECCRDYERPEDFAKLLFDDLRAAILRDYPEKKIFSALDEQFMRHIQVASQHCDVYVGHESVQQQIDEYIASAGTTGPRTPLILAGIAGSGKSAALANWLFRTSIVGFVFPHFCSATETSNSHDGILPRLASELKRSFGFEHDLPADKDELIELIPKWVTLACTSTPVVVILDGIDQLAETEARALAWLPNALPRNFSLLLSTSNDPLVLKSCASRGWNNIITMPKLSVADQDKLTADLLAWHNTTLESHLLLMLTKTTKTTSPLFLRMAIELLVVNNVATENSTTDGFSLQSLLSSCLQRPSASELANYLEASRFGMSEVEMIELLKMNQADWCFLFTAIRTLLCESVGLLIISGRVMRQAVRKRYFLDEAYVVAIHRELIDFFRTLSSSTMSDSIRIRCCTELPFHMIHAHELDMLSDYLLDVGRVRHLLMDSSLSRELTSLWAQVGSDRVQQHGSQYVDSLAQCEKELRKEIATSFKMLGQSRKDIKHASLDLLARIAGHLGSFLCESYQYHCAAALHKRAIEIDRGLIDDFGERVPEGFRLLANTQSLMGAYVDAISNYFMAAGIYAHCAKTQPSARIEYAQTLFEIAGVARYVEEETVVTLAPVLVRLAYLFYGLGPEEQEQARQYAEDAKKLCKDAESSDRTDERFDSTMAEATHVLAEILEDLALAHIRMRFDVVQEPIPPLDDKADDERISSGWTWPEGTIGDMLFAVLIPATTVAGHVVEFLRNLRDPKGGTDDEEAIDAMLVCALEIRRRKNGRGHVHVAHCLIRRAELLWNQSKYAEIIELYTEASKIFEDAAGTPKCKPVAQLASWMTVAHMNNNNFKRAEEEHKRAEELASQVFGLGSVAEATKHISATAVIATSWESYRVMMDKVRIYTSMALNFKLQAGNTPSAAREAMLERFGKLKAKAERHEAQARIVRDTLLKEDFIDDVLPHLSHYAPIHREFAGTQAHVQKRVVAKAASPPSGSGSLPKPSPASSPKSTRNTVTR
ncbi:tetratricopeptide repeat domain containing protein [Chrysochromulina tobinii]|uniref:Tetratricopeptide repeat domain containing protein n=1 Tax=Chrysochromulina tobinii TaxID=1460289 RepID=A0A0M0JNK9_9EUKA|nr:tetratricopeptide repeat domain containing protein [Chrysochromulina tobinii]|eukprot:KOO28055.1 tetratricopeptide repeat domain containing protein [Chrysochromulina sp. CCMP291]